MPDTGLHRTTLPMPGFEDEVPADVLVFVGRHPDGQRFVVRPTSNRRNRWFWTEPTLPLRAEWASSLRRLPNEGFYTLPETIELENGGRWLEHAIVQLGYNPGGQGILFIAEDHADELRNVLVFSSRGRIIEDELLDRLVRAPILPVPARPMIDPTVVN